MPEKFWDATELLKEAETVRKESEKLHSTGEYDAIEERLFASFGTIDYSSGKFEPQGEANLEFSLAPLTDADRGIAASYLTDARSHGAEVSGAPEWVALGRLSYSIGGMKFDVFEGLPAGFRILVLPGTAPHGALSHADKVIFIRGDIASMGALATILHEKGHEKDYERLEKHGLKNRVEGGDFREKDQAEILRKEREASLFALRKLWPLLRQDPQSKADTIAFLKNIAYYSYCSSSLAYLAHAVAMDHFAKDFEDDFDLVEQNRWEAWWRFSHSDEYQDWKQAEEFARLDDYEEYGAWCEWIEKTGKTNDAEFQGKYFKEQEQ